ncbi:hypothetical protein O159_12470 [Leifsonia xyli subsp. cynodontis DSM 46306]|uniref:GH18 domain-containing protein n=1 Tax=Leifsonia xyli subsp. cynodontis DSM 46306 TaxID=1389489 RepID=U3P4S8_LEIXC|nr:hypothetical protein [Leifsonia xyli]AGW41325.1 hypothetical protein O159_12470 [Leifsonia xyli subsp. cynodontis DSM 46306]
MWAWGNPIDKAVDERGMGQPAFQPSALSAFASAHQLKTVYFSVPWAADQGPFSAWLRSAVKALHGAGVTTVAALGGDASWASQPELAAAWTQSALTAAPFDAVQFDVEPWVNATDNQLPGIAGNLNNMYDAAAQAAEKVPIGADLPWWLAAKPAPSGGTLFGDLLSHLRSVAIVAFIDHAEGEDGIVTLARPAAAAASAAHIPFTIGVETDTPEVAGSANATFGDDSAAALEGQATIVRSRFSELSGYSGVAVEHLLSWKNLLNR